MSARDMQLEKSDPIPKPKRNSCWILSCLGLPAAGSQITGVDNQELTAHVDTKPAGSLVFPSGGSTASITPTRQNPGRSEAISPSNPGERTEVLC